MITDLICLIFCTLLLKLIIYLCFFIQYAHSIVWSNYVCEIINEVQSQRLLFLYFQLMANLHEGIVMELVAVLMPHKVMEMSWMLDTSATTSVEEVRTNTYSHIHVHERHQKRLMGCGTQLIN